MSNFIFLSNSPLATQALGKKIGEKLPPGSLITLTGELGCGKTLFTRGICAGIGVPLRQVNSPTFVLVNEYSGRLPVFHLDMYQLDASSDAVEFGLVDYLARAREGVMIIEWAEKIADVLPLDCLNIRFEILSVRQRRLEIADPVDKFKDLLKEIPQS